MDANQVSAADDLPILECDFQHLKCPRCVGLIRRTWGEEGVLHAHCERKNPATGQPCGTHMLIYSEGEAAAVQAVSPQRAKEVAQHLRTLSRLKSNVRRRLYGAGGGSDA